MPMLAISRWRSELSLCCSTALSQRRASSGPAPAALTVSSPPIVSTSTDCLSMPSPIALAESRSIAGWVSQPTRMTSGTISAGTSTTLPPMIQMTSEGEDDEGQVDDRGQGRRGEEVAKRLELAHQPGQRAGRALLEVEPQREQPLEQGLADLAVDRGAGDVDEIGAQQLQDEVEDDDDGEADRQRDQRRGGVVRHHPVVDRHREQRRSPGRRC